MSNAKSTVFFSQDAPSICIGPGQPGTADVVQFVEGYAEVLRDDPRYEQKVAWIRTVKAYRIEELGDADAGRVVPEGEDDKFACPKCAEQGIAKVFGNQRQLNGHLMSHRPKPQ